VWEQNAEENIWTEKEEATGGWIKLHNAKLHNLYFLPNMIMVIKPKRMS
jgi:hypothetical protein